MVRQAKAQAVGLLPLLGGMAAFLGAASAQTTPPPAKGQPPGARQPPSGQVPGKRTPNRQETGPVIPGGATVSDETFSLDRVAITVDTRVILQSDLEELYDAEIEQAVRRGEKVDPRSRKIIEQRVRYTRLQDAIRAQSAYNLRGQSLEQIQKTVELLLKRKQEDTIKRFGSINKMSTDILRNNSQYIEDQRDREQILSDLARQDFIYRFRDRMALLITPKEMRAHYERRRPDLRTTSRMDLAIVSFRIQDPEVPKPALAKARKASAAWKRDASSREIAEEFGGDALEDRLGVTKKVAVEETLSREFHPFLNGATGPAVDEPRIVGNRVFVLKITSWRPGDDFAWEDPEVQSLLRAELMNNELARIMERMDRDRAKTLKIWPPTGR